MSTGGDFYAAVMQAAAWPSTPVGKLYGALNPMDGETMDVLAVTIANEAAEADVQCSAWDTHWPDRNDRSTRLYRVTEPPKACSVQDAVDLAGQQMALERAVRYLILQRRIEVLEHQGQPWVRILPERTA